MHHSQIKRVFRCSLAYRLVTLAIVLSQLGSSLATAGPRGKRTLEDIAAALEAFSRAFPAPAPAAGDDDLAVVEPSPDDPESTPVPEAGDDDLAVGEPSPDDLDSTPISSAVPEPEHRVPARRIEEHPAPARRIHAHRAPARRIEAQEVHEVAPVQPIVTESEPQVVKVKTERVQKPDGTWVIRTTTTKRSIVTTIGPRDGRSR